MKSKKIINGGIYWINFEEFRWPEWGNKDGKPHLGVVIKINDFQKREMYLCFPLTSNYKFSSNLLNKAILEISLNDSKKSYILINQMRIISKSRILEQFWDENNQFKNLSFEQIVFLQQSLINFINHWFNNQKLNANIMKNIDKQNKVRVVNIKNTSSNMK